MSGEADLNERLKYGSEVERAEILAELRERYEATGELRDLNQLALACASAGRVSAAAPMWRHIVRTTPDSLASDVSRFSLATAYNQLGWYACSRHQFAQVAEHSREDELREKSRAQLEMLDEERAQSDEHAAWRRLQLARAIERIERGEATAAAAARLSRVVRAGLDTDPMHEQTRRAAEFLADAVREHPGDPELLRGLLYCQLSLADDGHKETLRALEALEPASEELASIAAAFAAERPVIPVPDTVRYLPELVELVADAPDDPADDLGVPALEDLRSFAERFPRHHDCSAAYGFGLARAGATEELRSHLGHFATLEQPTHVFHFNYGRLLALVGEHAQAQRHLRLALELADSEVDREDAQTELHKLAGR